MGLSSDRQFLGLVGYRLPGWFPYLPSQSRYNRRLGGLAGLLTVVQQRLARLLDAGGAGVADGTLNRCRQGRWLRRAERVRGRRSPRLLRGQSEYVWGVRLVLRADRRGLALAYAWCPPTSMSTSRCSTSSSRAKP